MAQNFRHSEILARARTDGKVVVETLAEKFGVTLQTIRRDLGQLCDEGLLTRVYGGALLPSGSRNIGYEDRRQMNAEAKAGIGRATAARIPNGASVFLDIGTTSEAVASALLTHSSLMVVTNNINVAHILAANPDVEILISGGVLRRSDGGLVGDITTEFVRQFKTDIAVIGASALDASGDVLDFDFREVRVSQAVMRHARRSILVADATKFARSAPVRIGDIGAFDSFVTDQAPAQSFVDAAEIAGTDIHVTGET